MTTVASVYVMEDAADGTLKVGYSTIPERRKWELGGLRLLHTSPEQVDARRVENLAHRILSLAGKRVHGRREWFHATLDEAKAAIDRAERIASGVEDEPAFDQSTTFSIRLKPDLVNVLKEMARRENRSVSNVIDTNLRKAEEIKGKLARDAAKRSAHHR